MFLFLAPRQRRRKWMDCCNCHFCPRLLRRERGASVGASLRLKKGAKNHDHPHHRHHCSFLWKSERDGRLVVYWRERASPKRPVMLLCSSSILTDGATPSGITHTHSYTHAKSEGAWVGGGGFQYASAHCCEEYLMRR